MKLGLIGCGAIGRTIAGSLDGLDIELAVIFDIKREQAERLWAKLSRKPKIAGDFKDFLDERVDLVVEAASYEAVKDYSEEILDSADLMIMSTSAFAIYPGLYDLLREKALKHKRKIYLPSGAIVGLDGVKSAAGEIAEVVLTTTKNPCSIEQTEYLTKKGISLKDLQGRKVLFQGPAREGAGYFPRNLNVLSTLSYCGIGLQRTVVRLIADPGIRNNTHEMAVKGRFGEFTTKAINLPAKDNPKTSRLAGLSAVATLKRILEPFQIGT